MAQVNLDAAAVKGWIRSFVQDVVWFALLFLIAAAVLKQFGVNIPYVPAAGHEWLAYTCGAYWLLRK